MNNENDTPTFRQELYRLLEEQEGFWGKVIQWLVTTMILLSALFFVLETLPEFAGYKNFFQISEYLFITIFTVEYLLRLFAQKDRFRWATRDPYALIDLFAILPFYLEFLLPFLFDTRIVRILRLLRVVSRILRVGRHSSALDVLIGVVRNIWKEVVTCLILASIVALIAATGIYYAEYVLLLDGGKPNPHFSDMGKCLWWSIVTLTTVGYGDLYPVTFFGRVVATIVMLGGVALIALPAGMVAGAFTDELKKLQKPTEQDRTDSSRS